MIAIEVRHSCDRDRYLVTVVSNTGGVGAVVLDLRQRFRTRRAANKPGWYTIAGIHKTKLEHWCDVQCSLGAKITWTFSG